MSSYNDSGGTREMALCHECRHEWRYDGNGLTCPECHSDFVEILDHDDSPASQERPQDEEYLLHAFGPDQFYPGPSGQPPIPLHSAPPTDPSQRSNQLQWRRTGPNTVSITGTIRAGSDTASMGNPGPLINLLSALTGGIAAGQPTGQGSGGANSRSYTYSSPNGRATFSYRTTTFNPRDMNNPGTPSPPVDDLPLILERLLHEQRSQGAPQDPHTNNLASHLFNVMFGLPIHMGGASGDVAWSQEEFDRIMSQLMEQSGRNAPGPASADAISTLPKRTVDQNMMGDTGKAECTICMDEVALGDVVTELYCKHWFHTQCITVWLNEHDTCPHCRKGIEKAKEESEAATAKAEALNRPPSSRHPSSPSVNANPIYPRSGPSSSSQQPPRRSSRNRSIRRDNAYDSPMDRDELFWPQPPPPPPQPQPQVSAPAPVIRSGRSTPPPSHHRRRTATSSSSSRERPMSSSYNDLPSIPRHSSTQVRRDSGSPRDRFRSDSYMERERERDRDRDYEHRYREGGAFRPGAYVRPQDWERDRDRDRNRDINRDDEWEADDGYGGSSSRNSRSSAGHRRLSERDHRPRGSEDRRSSSYGQSRDNQEGRERSGSGGGTGLFDRVKNLWQNRGGNS